MERILSTEEATHVGQEFAGDSARLIFLASITGRTDVVFDESEITGKQVAAFHFFQIPS